MPLYAIGTQGVVFGQSFFEPKILYINFLETALGLFLLKRGWGAFLGLWWGVLG